MSNIEIEGLDELLKNLNKLAKEIPDVAEEELADIALDLGSKSSKAAPVESGDLRGELARPRRKGPMHWQVGSSLPYTRRQHEGIHFNFKRGGGAKFLERPFRENQSVYIKRIKAVSYTHLTLPTT